MNIYIVYLWSKRGREYVYVAAESEAAAVERLTRNVDGFNLVYRAVAVKVEAQHV